MQMAKVLKRHEHEGDVEYRDSKRVRFEHRQPDKRADMELPMTQLRNVRNSSHQIAPNLHCSSGEIGDPGTRESVMKKSRVDADMEISAVEALTHAKLEVDRAQDNANMVLHRLLEEIPFESEAVTKAAELNSIRDKRVYIAVYEIDADAKIISGKWVLKAHTARYVLRGLEEDVKDGHVFASTTMTASVRMLLTQATDLRNEGYTVFTADVKIAFFSAHMKDGDVVYAKPPPEWQLETLDPSKGTVIWKLQEGLYGVRSAPRRWQDHLDQILSKCGFVPNLMDTRLWTHDEGSITRIQRGRLVVGWNAPDHQGNPHRIEPRPGAQEQRGDDKINALLGTNPGRKRRRSTTLELMLRVWKACWRSSTCPR